PNVVELDRVPVPLALLHLPDGARVDVEQDMPLRHRLRLLGREVEDARVDGHLTLPEKRLRHLERVLAGIGNVPPEVTVGRAELADDLLVRPDPTSAGHAELKQVSGVPRTHERVRPEPPPARLVEPRPDAVALPREPHASLLVVNPEDEPGHLQLSGLLHLEGAIQVHLSREARRRRSARGEDPEPPFDRQWLVWLGQHLELSRAAVRETLAGEVVDDLLESGLLQAVAAKAQDVERWGERLVLLERPALALDPGPVHDPARVVLPIAHADDVPPRELERLARRVGADLGNELDVPPRVLTDDRAREA